jgi:hypothetical protein
MDEDDCAQKGFFYNLNDHANRRAPFLRASVLGV